MTITLHAMHCTCRLCPRYLMATGYFLTLYDVSSHVQAAAIGGILRPHNNQSFPLSVAPLCSPLSE